MSLLELGPIAFGGTPAIVSFLQDKHVLARQKQCVCGCMMVMQDRSDVSDGCCLRCSDCNKRVSIRKGSFFEKSKLTLQKWLLLMHFWCRQYPVKDAAEEVEVSEATTVQVYQWMREVCSHRLCVLDPPIKLGGNGQVVAIDESLFSHKPKVLPCSTVVLQKCTCSSIVIHFFSITEGGQQKNHVGCLGYVIPQEHQLSATWNWLTPEMLPHSFR